VIFILFISKFFHNILKSNQFNKDSIYDLIEFSLNNEIFLSVQLIVLLCINYWEISIFKNFSELIFSKIKVMWRYMICIFIWFKRISSV